MRGQLVQRSPGSWTIVIYIGRDPSTGKKLYKQHTIHGSKKDAERKRTQLLHSLDTGSYQEPTRESTGEYLTRWLRDYVKPHVSPTTRQGYEGVVNQHLIPQLGPIQLSRLSRGDIKAYYARALQSGRHDGTGGLSPTTVLQHHRILREALKHAVNDGLLVTNPADRVAAPRRVCREMPVLNEVETTRLLDIVDDTKLHVPVLLAVATGLRRGEILALRWQDIDLKAGALAVRQTLETTKAGLAFKQPKTQKSRRLVPLPTFAIEALRTWKKRQAEERLRLGPAYHSQDLVCATADGSPWPPNNLTSSFCKLLRNAGLAHVRFHDLRHGHASMLLKAGVHPKVVSERLGHSTVGLTLDTYSHVLPGLQEDAARKIEKIFKG